MNSSYIQQKAGCLGCSLAHSELPVHIVYENEWVTCLLDHDPFGEGHVLILPKQHYRFIDEFDGETATAMLHASQLISKTIRSLYVPHGLTLVQNGGAVDDLTHFHLHVVPRAIDQPFADFYTEDEWNNKQLKKKLAETRNQLAAAIDSQLALLPGK